MLISICVIMLMFFFIGKRPAGARDRKGAGRGSGGGLSGEEMARIRNLPRVREVLETFGGHIEEVRRSDDG